MHELLAAVDADAFWTHVALLAVGAVCTLAAGVVLLLLKRTFARRDEEEKKRAQRDEQRDNKLANHEERIGDLEVETFGGKDRADA